MARQPTALITGYTGQDGTFLTKLLLDKGYRVIGLTRRISTEPPIRVRGRFDFSDTSSKRLIIESGDLESVSSLIGIIYKYQPDEIYNLAAQSHVGTSFHQPESTIATDLLGLINLITALEAAAGNDWRLYQASTSEMFGYLDGGKIDERTPLNPVSPYAIAKTAAHQYCKMKRDQGRFISCGILFNHESEIRGADFVTMKITRAVASGEQLALGNLNAKRDWGYAEDYVFAMWLMLQQEQPDDFVIGTGETHSVRDFVEAAYAAIDKEVVWSGVGLHEVGHVDGRPMISIDPQFYRPNEVPHLLADNTKALEVLRWKPNITFESLVKLMVKEQQK